MDQDISKKNYLENFEKIAYPETMSNLSETRASGQSINFLFHISDVDTSVTKKDQLKQRMMKTLKMTRRTMTCDEFDLMVKKICNCCLKHIKDLHELHIKRCAALEMLNEVIDRMDVSCVKTAHVVHLVWSIMSCIHHFQLRFRTGTRSIIAWTRKKKAQKCMHTYSRLVQILPTSTYRVVLNSLIIFYKEGRLWTIEFRLTDLICELLYLYTDIEEAIEDILSTAENSSLNSDVEPRMLIKVLYEILGIVKWGRVTEDLIRRFLIMLRKSIVPKPEYIFNYGPMRSGLNICLRNITKNLNNHDLMVLLVIIVKKITFREMEDDTLLEFGSIGEYAAHRYKTGKFTDSFPEVLLENLMIMMSSENSFHHLFAHRILENVVDRHSNKLEFENPRINLENIYTMLALTLVEIPCSYVASSTVCFGMAMQEFILNSHPTSMVACHHVHAIVMSLISLACYIHKAEVFYNYVNTIMERRSELAPHLNPPLKAIYSYAQHHILWNKPELFFEDWEARYGLWKCFRTAVQRNKHMNTSELV